VNVSLGIRLLEVDPQSAAGKAALDSGVRLMEELSAGEQDVRVALAGVLENQAWANGTTAEQRRRCLERVRTIREELAKAEHAGSAAVQWLALTYMNLVAAGAREPQEEVAYLGRVRELCRTLDFHNRANVRGAQVFVAATVQLADWLLPSKPAKASELYDEAIALAEQLLQRDGENEHLRDLLAMSYNGKGRSLRGADAIPWFQKTCAVRERLLLDQRRTLSAPDMTRRVLLQGYHNLALEQIRALRTLEAAHTCERIIQVGEDLVPVWPQDSTIKYVIGVASWHLGAIRSPFGFSPERLALTTKAIKYLSEAVEAVPRDAPARSELCWMLEELAAHEARDGKRDAALERYSRTAGHLRELRAQKAASPKDVERFKSVLRAIVRIQRELGQSSDAAASELRELEPSKPAGDLKP